MTQKGKASNETPSSAPSHHRIFGTLSSCHLPPAPLSHAGGAIKRCRGAGYATKIIPQSSYGSDRGCVNMAPPKKDSKPNSSNSPPVLCSDFQSIKTSCKYLFWTRARWWHLRQQVPGGRQRPLLPPAPLKWVPKGSLPDHRLHQNLQDQIGVCQGCFPFTQEQQEHPAFMPK